MTVEDLQPAALRELRRISQGPGTEVYQALAPDDRPVLLKRFSLQRAADWKELDLFEREVQVLRQLEHPRLPQLLAAGIDETGHYLISSWIEGSSLAEQIAAGRRWSEDEVRELARQLLGILIWLHDRQPPIVHRDIKPSNLLLGPAGELFLIDFGSVLLRVDAGGSTVAGTFGYMAPEQFSGRALPASDLYALGATMVHLLSGTAPAEMPHERLHLGFESYLQGVPGLLSWLRRLLAPLPEDRFASARDALSWLEHPPALAVSGHKLPAALRAFTLAEMPPAHPGQTAIASTSTEAGIELVLPPRPLAREHLGSWLLQGVGGGAACYAALALMAPLHLTATVVSGALIGIGTGAIGTGLFKGLQLRKQGLLQTHLRLEADGMEIETRHAELTETRLQIPWLRVYALEVSESKSRPRLMLKYLNAAGQMQSLCLAPQLDVAELSWLRDQILAWKDAAQASKGRA